MGWTSPGILSPQRLHLDFNVSLTEEQQREEASIQLPARGAAAVGGGEGPVAEIPSRSTLTGHYVRCMTGTDVATYTRERPA